MDLWYKIIFFSGQTLFSNQISRTIFLEPYFSDQISRTRFLKAAKIEGVHLEDFIIRYSDFRPKKEKAPSESIKPLLHLSLDKKEGRPVAVPGQELFHVPVSLCSEQGQDQLSRDVPGQNHNLIIKKRSKKV